MQKFKKVQLLVLPFMMLVLYANAKSSAHSSVIAFSAIKGAQSKPDTLLLKKTVNAKDVEIAGLAKTDFKLLSFSTAPKGKIAVLVFAPQASSSGIENAVLRIKGPANNVTETFELSGLTIAGAEIADEPSLASIVKVLAYKSNVGWSTLSNHMQPELCGDEIEASLFKKAHKGKVQILPVARFSADSAASFGYYINTKEHGPEKREVGAFSQPGRFSENQTISPSITSGSKQFDPGENTFGFFNALGAKRTAYSEDVWNMLYFPENAVRGARIYPLKDKSGIVVKNSYLLCFDEGNIGAYNSYVYIVNNIVPVTDDMFTTIFDGKSLNGWHSFLKGIGSNTDPNHNFRLEDGMLHVIGKDLGYEITDKGFFNFHAKVQFKWGVSKWPPRQNAKRDGGFLYNIPMNEPDSIWPKSIECQIQEGDVGDFWMLGFSTMTVGGKTNRPTNHIQFVKKRDNERPYGEWNTVEVISYNGRCVQIVNGEVVNYGDNASVKGGRLILQSEYSEIYYRNVRVRQL